MRTDTENKLEIKKLLLQDKKRCFICGSINNIHRHHIFFGLANRKKSEEDAMWVYLCALHHNMSAFSVHNNKDLDMKIKQRAEKVWINTYPDKDLTYEEKIEKFIDRYGKNYLD